MLSAELSKSLSQARMDDAVILLQNHRYSGAYYLAGYAVELALKALIANQFMAGVIPDKAFVINIHSHDLIKLRGLAGLSKPFDDYAAAHAGFEANWLIASQWSEASRYEMIDQFQALELISAINSPEIGVLSWLKTRW